MEKLKCPNINECMHPEIVRNPNRQLVLAIVPAFDAYLDDPAYCESFGTAVGGHGCEFIKTCPVYAKLKMAAIVKEDLVADARDCSNPFKEVSNG